MKSTLIVYWSRTGNTEKVAQVVREGLEKSGMNAVLLTTDEAEGLDFFNYDLVYVGSPSYQWHPPEPMVSFLKSKFNEYRSSERITLGAPKVPGKNALIFCTYSGPHTGTNEAVPAVKYIGQFFEHLGFRILDEWYILSEFHGSEERSIKGRRGDIRGKPSQSDLNKIRKDAEDLVNRL